MLDYRFYMTDRQLQIRLQQNASPTSSKDATRGTTTWGWSFDTYLMDKTKSRTAKQIIFCALWIADPKAYALTG